MANNPFQTPPAPATPWPLPPATMGTLLTTPARISRLTARWPLTTGIYSRLTSTSSGWASTQAQATTGFGYALKYLATGTPSFATSAYTAATTETFAYDTDAARMWSGSAPFVYAWCKGALTPTQNTTLINQIDTENQSRETNIGTLGKYLLDGPGNGNVGISGYIFGVVAITGQTLVTGLTDRRTNLRNLVQNLTNYFLETCGDGWWSSYDLLAENNWWCILAYHIGTGEESLIPTRFPWLNARPEVLIRMLGTDSTRSWGNPSHNAWWDVSGMNWTSQYPEPAFASATYGDVAQDATAKALAKYHQTTMNNNVNATYGNNPWTQLAVLSDSTWAALLYSDDNITPLSPASAGIPMCKAWPITGIAEFRGGWNQSTDLVCQMMAGPAPQNDHNHNKAGSITVRAGTDWLVKNGYVYSGRASPATWEGAVPMFIQEVGGYPMCQSGPLFVPQGSETTRPDRDASLGVINAAPSAPASSATDFPLSATLTNNVRQTWSSGSMSASDWYDDGSLAKMVGTYTKQFRQITTGKFTVGYIRGASSDTGTIVVYDQFTAPGTINYIRRNFWSFAKPTILGETVQVGSTTAGVLTATGDHVVVTRGTHQATIQFVTPLDGIDVIGGLGYESWFDGYPALAGQTNGANYDYMTYAHIADNRTTTSFGWLQGQWRTSFRTTNAIANGEMLVVITVSNVIGSTAPTYNRASALALLNPGAPISMPGNSQYWNAKILNATTGKVALVSPTLYAAACSVMGSDAGTGFTEVSGLGYQRKQMAAAGGDWNTSVVASPATVTNANDIVWATATGAWPQIVGVAFWDSLTGGNLICSDFLGAAYWAPFTCTAASPGVITHENHGLTNGQFVAVTTKFGGVLPTLSAGSWGGLLTVANATTNTYTLTTSGAVALNTSSVGSGSVRQVVPVTVNSGNNFRIQAGLQTIAQQ